MTPSRSEFGMRYIYIKKYICGKICREKFFAELGKGKI